MPKKNRSNKKSKKGGDVYQDLTNVGQNIVDTGKGVVSSGENFVNNQVMPTITSAGTEAAGLASSAYENTQVALGSAANKAKGFFGNWSWPWSTTSTTPTNVVGGSRRRRKGHRKTKSAFKGLMNIMGIKTKKRKHHGGSGYKHLIGANFPSAANAEGNNIYNLSTFNPSQPFYGGKTKRHRKK